MTEYHAKMYATDGDLGEAIDRFEDFEWSDLIEPFIEEPTRALIVLRPSRKRAPVTLTPLLDEIPF